MPRKTTTPIAKGNAANAAELLRVFAGSYRSIPSVFSPERVYLEFERSLEGVKYTKLNLEGIPEAMKENNAIPINRIGLFISAALNRIIMHDEIIVLNFRGAGRPDFVGFQLPTGKLYLEGDLGHNIGKGFKSISKIQTIGNVGEYAACEGEGVMVIKGNSGEFTGSRLKGTASIDVHGSVGSHSGWGMEEGAKIIHRTDGIMDTITRRSLLTAVRGTDGE